VRLLPSSHVRSAKSFGAIIVNRATEVSCHARPVALGCDSPG
jgi:hypothetical protein